MAEAKIRFSHLLSFPNFLNKPLLFSFFCSPSKSLSRFADKRSGPVISLILPSRTTDTVPLSSETTTTTASDLSESPRAARCLEPY